MSVKVERVDFFSEPNVTDGVPHEFNEDIDIFVEVIKANVRMKIRFGIKKGFKCDGASIPWMFRWFLPSWAKKGCGFGFHIYNMGAAIHDGLYIHKGFGLFSREECDDILRGIWRESGISRFKAGVADKAVEWFAGGKNHFGNDSYKVGDFFSMEF